MTASQETRPPPVWRLVLVSGMSGAGRSLALKTFEDIGFDAVDNMPLALLGSLTGGEPSAPRDLAVGVDVRTRDFGPGPVIAEMDKIMAEGKVAVSLLFLESSDEVLQRRFTETRRPHPLATDRPVLDGIIQERQMLGGLRSRADLVIDTTDLIPGELKRILAGHFGEKARNGLSVFVRSFSYRNGVPRDADLVFDVRFLANPYYVPELRDKTGIVPEVGAFIAQDSQYRSFFDALTGLLEILVPGYIKEGKRYLTIAVGCTGGRHRSVYVAEMLGQWLKGKSIQVGIGHRDAGPDSSKPDED